MRANLVLELINRSDLCGLTKGLLMCKHPCQNHDEILKHGKLNVHFQTYMWQTELTNVSAHKYFCCCEKALGNLDRPAKYENDFLPH